MVTRKHRELSDDEIKHIYDTYHNWRDLSSVNKQLLVAENESIYKTNNSINKETNKYEDIQGFCKSANIEEVRGHEYILTPGRYVGIEEVEDDGEPFDEKMTRLTGELSEMFAKSHELEDEIKQRLGAIGYEF